MDHLLQLHKICVEELQKLQQNIKLYLESSNTMIDLFLNCWQAVSDDNAFALLVFDRFLTSLSNMMDLSRKFNLQLRLNELEEEHCGRKLFEALRCSSNFAKEQKKGFKAIEAKAEPKKTKERPAFVPKVDQEKKITQQKSKQAKKSQKSPTINGNKQVAAVKTNKLQEQRPKQRKPPVSIPPIEENEEDSSSSRLDLTFAPQFSYAEKELTVYKPGSLLKASVTYLQDAEALRLYACDAECSDMLRVAALRGMLGLRQYTGLPPEQEVFGLVVDDMILRAVRRNTPEADDTLAAGKREVLLLDFGEVVEMSASDVSYHLPAEQQQISAQAMCCELRGIAGRKVGRAELRERFLQLEYTQAKFQVTSVEKRVLRVELIEEEKSQAECDFDKLELLEVSGKAPHAPNGLKQKTKPKITNAFDPFYDNKEAIPLSALPRKPKLQLFKDDGPLPNGLTVEDLELLEEEPLNTSNAMVAVMGYNPKDEQRICRFYNPETGTCFKGSNCRQEHTLMQPDGWTKDRLLADTIVRHNQPTVRYAHGTIINIMPTYVVTLERFYAHINQPKQTLEPLIWNEDEIQRLRKAPQLFDLVLARYEDSMWYRAKVEEFDETRKFFKVFYVDYGNQQFVPLHDLARCDAATTRLPFQATLCRLADVALEPGVAYEKRKAGLNMLNRAILNCEFDVKVLGDHDELLVRFLGEKYGKIPDQLVAMGCAKRHKFITN